jgi:cell division protein FtsQ
MNESSQLVTQSLKTRRQTLRSQRRLRAGQGVWRFFALLSLTVGLFWLMSLPSWLIRDSSQVIIDGNQLIPQQQIYRWLSLRYPLSFWQVPIAQIQSTLETQAPITSVKVMRQLSPPQIQIYLQERQPIAIAIAGKQRGFLDEEGVFISGSLYPQGEKFLSPPYLKVIGFDRLEVSLWRKIFKSISQSSIKIESLDWRDPSNLILNTELGRVQLGGESTKLAEQFKTLSQLRSLTSRVPSDRISTIDLGDPRNPLLKLKPVPKPEMSTNTNKNPQPKTF